MDVETTTQDKTVLRRKFKELRTEFAQAQGADARGLITDNLQRLLGDFHGFQIGLYRPLPDEAAFDLKPIADFFYPFIRDQELEFFKPKTASDFKPGSLGIEEPIPARSTALDPSRPSLICCPAVAVDSQGMRIGLGKGFYDRFFTRTPGAIRIGVVFHVQMSADPLPAESWDQALDWIVTEKAILRPHSRRSS